jgi:ethanolamine ammonia-lyase small subunit
VSEDPWAWLRQFTEARIALGRCGASWPTDQWLAFRLAHAQARDAVLSPFDQEALQAELAQNAVASLRLRSAARDKNEFLTRPDQGRRLSSNARDFLEEYSRNNGPLAWADVCLVISDGLSARAVHQSAAPFALEFLACLAGAHLSATPVVLVEFGRVAVADEVAALLRARLAVILIGERPGLSSPNSLGAYMTYDPAPGRTDETRNCISNIRPGGLSIAEGVRKLCYLAQKALELKFSGFRLKDDMPAHYLPFGPAQGLPPCLGGE